MEICGIDEAGRGPIAGPLVMAGCVFKRNVDELKEFEWYKKLNDSKKLSEKEREELFEKIKENSIFHIVFVSNSEIDNKGLSFAIKKSLLKIKEKINARRYLFDGNSNFGVEGIETIIKGDGKIKEISAASILAKVSRDRFMREIDKKYPEYNFKKHKGYITKEHIELIKKYGFCEIHRKSYRLKALEPTLF
jgi:ribonuclease HII